MITEKAQYDKNDSAEFFEQCFDNKIKIGEGSFGEVSNFAIGSIICINVNMRFRKKAVFVATY